MTKDLPPELNHQLKEVAEEAARACAAPYASIRLLENEHAVIVAEYTPLATHEEAIPITLEGGAWHAIHKLETVHHDIAEGSESGRRIAARDGWRTTLMVPLVVAGAGIGYLTLRRAEVNPFTDAQIATLRTYADRAATLIARTVR
jgi:hypothetical protein